MTTQDPISRISVVSTGSVQIRPEHVGPTSKSTYRWLATSRRWTAPRPINVYVIEHREGLVVADVRIAVLSHLHQDHIGGLSELDHAEIVVSEPEWKTLQRPLPALRGFLRSHIELPGLRWHRVRAERLDDPDLAPFDAGHDVFADGSLLLLPTPGHTPGSMSLLVRRPGHAPVMLVGDLTYDADLLAAGHVPGAGDKAQMRKTVAGVNALRQRFPDLTVLAAHDPTAADRLATALTMATARP